MAHSMLWRALEEILPEPLEIPCRCAHCGFEISHLRWNAHAIDCQKGQEQKGQIFAKLTERGFTNILIIRQAGWGGRKREVSRLTQNGEQRLFQKRASKIKGLYGRHTEIVENVEITADLKPTTLRLVS